MWFPSPGGPQSRVKDKAIKKVHMETPNVGRIITVPREEQVQFWGLRGHICGGVWESCLGNGDSSTKVQKGRNKQPVGAPPGSNAGKADALEPGQGWSPSQGSRSRGQGLGKEEAEAGRRSRAPVQQSGQAAGRVRMRIRRPDTAAGEGGATAICDVVSKASGVKTVKCQDFTV